MKQKKLVHLAPDETVSDKTIKTYCGLRLADIDNTVTAIVHADAMAQSMAQSPLYEYELCENCDMDFHGNTMRKNIKRL